MAPADQPPAQYDRLDQFVREQELIQASHHAL